MEIVSPTKGFQLQAFYQLASSLVFSSVFISDSFQSGLGQYHLFQQTTPPMMLNGQPLSFTTHLKDVLFCILYYSSTIG